MVMPEIDVTSTLRRHDMAQTAVSTLNRPAWVELSSSDAAASRDYYSKLFGWQVEVNPDPQYGGYAIAQIGDQQVGGIGPTQSADQPTAWGLYIGTDNVDALAQKVQSSGGTVVAPPFDVGDQGRMSAFQDPVGAFISAWQASAMRPFVAYQSNSFGWAELNARGVDKALPFYESIFGWTHRATEMAEGQPPYTEFLLDGESIAGAWEMNPAMPANMPSYWTVYFLADDVDAAFRKALDLGGREQVAPQDFPGGRFAIVGDALGASFGLLKMAPR
jgi:predicted enzyme related to lactoylglutathione lyase